MSERKKIDLSLSLLATCAIAFITPTSTKAQIIPDGTLGRESSIVTSPDLQQFIIEGGATRDNNLFHSFSEFNLDRGQQIHFNNSPTIGNIFTRVTGNNASQINGIINSVGTANLFLINPNGIIFQENATLNIGGSFFTTTGESILFKDGSEFNAVQPNDSTLLTVSIPIGLQLGKNPGNISVNGTTGHNLTGGVVGVPFTRSGNATELRVEPTKSITLIGGNINLNKGVLVAEEGIINLASFHEGKINFTTIDDLIVAIDRSDLENLGTINLEQKSLLDASGIQGGSINIQSNNLNLANSSQILIQNINSTVNNKISLDINDDINLTTGSLISTESLQSGSNAAINTSAKNLNLSGGAGINSFAYQNSSVSSMNFQITDNIKVIGFNTEDVFVPTAIASFTFSSVRSSAINISATNLLAKDGGNITTGTFNTARGGNITLNILESIDVMGTSLSTFPASINVFSGGIGSAGDLEINTNTLNISDSGAVSVSTTVGNSGNLTINARESIQVIGRKPLAFLPSTITASVEREFSEIPVPEDVEIPTFGKLLGTSGAIEINTPKLTVANEAQITATNDGIQDAGNIKINADSLSLENRAEIVATTQSGNGGNINFKITEDIVLRHQSQISSTAGRDGIGGNIAFDTTLLTALENSDITANAENNFGGRVIIDAEGVFGTQTRNSLSPKSDITATSSLGAQFDGEVRINTPDADPVSEASELPGNFTDASQQIVAGCSLDKNSSFVVTGRGGLPTNPQEFLRGQNILQDWRTFDIEHSAFNIEHLKQAAVDDNNAPIREAEKLVVNDKGEIELVAANRDRIFALLDTGCNS